MNQAIEKEHPMAKLASALKPKAKSVSGEIEINFEYFDETKNTFKFKELDENGSLIEDVADAKIGMLYLKKSAFEGGLAPKSISVKIAY